MHCILLHININILELGFLQFESMSQQRMFYLVIPLLLVAEHAAREMPAYMSKCPSREPAKLKACALERANAAYRYLGSKGDKKYHINPVDPIFIPFVETNNNGMKLAFIDMKISSDPPLSYTVEDVDLDLDGHTMKFTSSAPTLLLESKYKISGRMLLLPIQGEGDSLGRLENPKMQYSTYLRLVRNDKDGLDYVKFENSTLHIDVTKAHLNLTNLFGNDSTLGKTILDFIDQNWKDVFEETKQGPMEGVKQYITATLQSLADVIPYKDIFPQ